MPLPARSSSSLLILSLGACVIGLGALAGVVRQVAAEVSRSRSHAIPIKLPAPEERMREPGMVARGAAVFEKQCFGCHGHFLEGGEGPCLTDAAWLKGSAFNDIRKSINEGSSEKGMPAFDTMLSEDEKIGLVAFIKSRAQGLRRVHYRLYEGAWKKLPDFTALASKEEGDLKADEPISLAKFERSAHYGLLFTGELKVPVAGEYTFELGSDDGAQLLVDGLVVADNDGLHASKPKKTGVATLAPGNHAFELRYFQLGANQDLNLTWRGPVSAGFLTEPVAAKEQILVLHEVRTVRGPVQGLPGAYHLMVGFPGGVNCAVDLAQGTIPLAWRGEFLDVGGARLDRGTSPNTPLGAKPVSLAPKAMLRLASNPQEAPEYLGCRLGKTQVVLHWRLGGARFDETLRAIPAGLEAAFSFEDPVPGPLQVTEPSGKSRTVPAAEAQAVVLTFPF